MQNSIGLRLQFYNQLTLRMKHHVSMDRDGVSRCFKSMCRVPNVSRIGHDPSLDFETVHMHRVPLNPVPKVSPKGCDLSVDFAPCPPKPHVPLTLSPMLTLKVCVRG